MDTLVTERIAYALDATFADKVDVSDCISEKVEDRRVLFLSRALAAYSLQLLADVDAGAAGASVTDGMNDGGLDAIYFDTNEKCLYLVQSKWSHKAAKTISRADALSFVAGIKSLISAEFSAFNEKIKARQAEVMGILRRADVRIVLVVAYTSNNPIGEQVESVFTEFLDEQNEVSDPQDPPIFSLEKLDLSRVYKRVSGGSASNRVNLQIALNEWGTISSPHRAYYGQLEVASIAQWAQFGKVIYDRNLRFYRGRSDVNEAIERTLTSQASDFWYFNNGITILCSKITKLPLNGNNRDYAVFDCDGVSVVNGAQTVGVICDVAARPGSAAQQGVKVHARIISLEDCSEEFAHEIARATNTQNRIERRDFAALDVTQHRLAAEMALDGKRYVFKSSGDEDPRGDDGCGIDEATVALACALGDVSLAVQAKREVGKLWEHIDRDPYTRLFNDKLEARHMWRAVRVLRTVADRIDRIDRGKHDRGDLVSVHGNRFILHRVFQDPGVRSFRDLGRKDVDVFDAASTVAERVFADLCDDIARNYANAYLANLFKNTEKCREIDARLTRGVSGQARNDLLPWTGANS